MTCKRNCECKKQTEYVSPKDWQDNLKNITVPVSVDTTTYNFSNYPKIDNVTVLIKKLDHCVAVPEYKTLGAAAMDLYAAEEIVLYPSAHGIVGTGVALAIPPGYEGQIRARSSLAAQGIIVLNAPGTIDSDYRGEIKVLLANLGTLPTRSIEENRRPANWANLIYPRTFEIHTGDRIAQLVIAPIANANLQIVDDLGETQRGVGGLGSTGI